MNRRLFLIMILAFFSAFPAFAGGNICFRIGLERSVPGGWAHITLKLPADFRRSEFFSLDIQSVKKGGRFWQGTLSCTSQPGLPVSCYGNDDRGGFKFQSRQGEFTLTLNEALNVGYEEDEDTAVIAPEGKLNAKGVRVPCEGSWLAQTE